MVEVRNTWLGVDMKSDLRDAQATFLKLTEISHEDEKEMKMPTSGFVMFFPTIFIETLFLFDKFSISDFCLLFSWPFFIR